VNDTVRSNAWDFELYCTKRGTTHKGKDPKKGEKDHKILSIIEVTRDLKWGGRPLEPRKKMRRGRTQQLV